MQTQQQNVHVKVSCDNEFRRFVLVEVTYNSLAEMIRTLLGFAPETAFKLSYLDDENDWVLFSSDSELQYAVTLSKSPLKISVKRSTTPAPITNTFVPEVAGEDGMDEKPWKRCRGGRGGARGGCRGGRNMAVVAERIDAKIARLTDRHATLTAKMIECDLPEEKARGIEWRLSHLQNKIEMLKARKQQLADAVKQEDQQETQVPVCCETVQDEAVPSGATPTEEEAFFPSCRGRRGGRGCRGGRGGWRREQLGSEEEPFEKKVCAAVAFACSTAEGKAAFEKLQACKEAVMAARRDKAGKEVVAEKLEELRAAKANWKEVKWALWKEKRAAAGASCTKEAK